MMEHWFDRATKFVAGASVARRDVLRNATIAGIGALLPDLSWGQVQREANPRSPGSNPPQTPHTIVLKPPRKPITRVLGACHFQMEGPTTMLSYGTETIASGVPVNLRMQVKLQGLRLPGSNTPAINTSHFLEITSGKELIVRMDAAIAPVPLSGPQAAEGKMSFTYGPGVKGVQSAELNVRNGTISGTVDRREILPVHPGSNASAIRFADGRPATSASLPAGLEAAVQQVLAKAQGELKACGKGSVSPLEHAPEKLILEPRRNLAQAGLASVDAIDPGRNTLWGGGSTDSCFGCANSCHETFALCLLGAGVSGFFCPPCAAGVAAGCYTAWGGCWAACFTPGIGGCCGTYCIPFDCCDKGQVCCGTDGCCDHGEVCNSINSTCCPTGAPVPCDEGCCSPNTTCCGTNCCPQGTVCVDHAHGICCPQGKVCGQKCCPQGEFCVDAAHGLCCPQPNMINCNGVCCASPSNCINGLCCPHPNMINCNGACCSSSSRCVNRGTICCDGLILCGDKCCNIADGPCCNGVCCASNQLCVGGKCQTKACPTGEVPCPVTPGQCCPPNTICCEGKLCCDPSKTECCGPRGCVPRGTCIQ